MEIIYPPRPRSKLSPAQLPALQASTSPSWVAQWKYNGTRTLVYIELDRTVKIYQRDGSPHRAYQLSDATRRDLLNLALQEGKGYILDGELMHGKTKDIKDTIVLYDLLWEESYLFGTTVAERLLRLDRLCRHPAALEPTGRGLAVSEHLWMAPTFADGFVKRYQEAVPDPAREGLVLKQPEARLTNLGRRYYEVDWMVRVRKPAANYQF